jgi:hypothetical protein
LRVGSGPDKNKLEIAKTPLLILIVALEEVGGLSPFSVKMEI